MSAPPPGRIPARLPLTSYLPLTIWTALFLAGLFTVYREAAYVHITEPADAFWTYAPLALSAICLIQIIGHVKALRRQRRAETRG